MKITIVLGPYNPVPLRLGGAVERVHWALARQFALKGHDTTLICRKFDELASHEVLDGVRILRVPSWDAPKSRFMYRAYDYIYSRRVAKMLPAADVTVTNSVFLPLLLPLPTAGNIYVHAARFPKRQMVYYRRAARIQTVSEVVAAAIRRQAPSLSDKVVSIPNPLSDEHDRHPPLAVLRPKTILYVGRIAREKGLDLIVKAFVVKGPLADYRLRIMGPYLRRQQGDGEEYLAELKSLAQPAAQAISFDEPVFDAALVRKAYLEADIFVYPSVAEKGETFGLAPLEAMAAGCRCIVSSLECFQEYVVAGHNALVFDHRSRSPIEALKQALTALAAGEGEQMRQAGINTAAQFRASAIADRYIADFQRVLEQRNISAG